MKKFLALLVAIMMLMSCSIALAEPYTGEEVTLRVFGWETYSDDKWDSYLGQWFQSELGNVKIQSEICPSDSSTLINLYMDTGDDMPDIMMYRSAQNYLDLYADSGRLLNLNDYAEYMPEYQARREKFAHLSAYDTADGETFLIFPCLADRASEVWFKNDDLMQKYGLETPTTWEEVEKCLEVVCAGEGWDGTNASPWMNINWGFGYNYQSFSTMWGIRRAPNGVSYDFDKGEWVYNLLEYADTYKDITTEMAEAYAKGWIHKDLFTMTQADFVAYAQSGKWLFMNHYVDFASQSMAGTMAGDYNFSYMVSPVAGDNTKPYVCMDYVSDNSGWCYGISADCKNPEVAAMYLEFITSDRMGTAIAWGLEGVTYTVDENGVKSFTEEYLADKAADSNAAVEKYGIAGVSYYWQPYCSTYAAFDGVYANWPQVGIDALRDVQRGIQNGDYQVYYGLNTPKFDDVTKEDISMITTPVGTYISENIQLFVTGQKDLAEWDAFVEGVTAYGDVAWVLEQYNTAEPGAVKGQQADRTYPQVP